MINSVVKSFYSLSVFTSALSFFSLVGDFFSGEAVSKALLTVAGAFAFCSQAVNPVFFSSSSDFILLSVGSGLETATLELDFFVSQELMKVFCFFSLKFSKRKVYQQDKT